MNNHNLNSLCLILYLSIIQVSFSQEVKLGLPLGHTSLVCSANFSPDGKTIITASMDNTARLWDQLSGKLLRTFEGHTEIVTSAVFSPDGKSILTTSWDYTARLWDASSGKLIHILEGHTDNIESAVFSPDGKKIITASIDSTAKLWDVYTGHLLQSLEGHADLISSAVFSPDSNNILTASWDNTARIWDVSSGKLLNTLKGHVFVINSAVFSPDGKSILTASGDYSARLWDVFSGKQTLILEGHTSFVNYAVFSPDGKSIITASDDYTTRLWDASSGKLIHIFEGHTNSVNSAVFSPNGKSIITASDDFTARIWDVSSGELINIFEGHTEFVNSAVFSPNGKLIVTSYGHNFDVYENITTTAIAKLWDASSGKLMHSLKAYTSSVDFAVYSPDGKSIITASSDNTARHWDVATGRLMHSLEGHSDYITSAVFSPEGKSIVTASWDNTARIWDVSSGKLIHILEGHTDNVNSAIFSPDGKSIITASSDNTARHWDVLTGKQLHILEEHKSVLTSVVFSPDGKSILTGSGKGPVKLWDASTGKLILTFKGHKNEVNSVVFSPDGKSIITASWDSTARLWDIYTGKLLHTFKGHTSVVNSAIFSPDGKSIITASSDNTARHWDVLTGKLLHTLEGHSGWVNSVQFSSKGKYIVTASDDYTSRLWDTSTGKSLYILEGHSREVVSAVFSHDGKTIITASWDGSTYIWDVVTGKQLIRQFIFDSKYPLWLLPSNYYMASKEAASKLYYIRGFQTIGFEQLDVKYNRPDKVLKVLGDISGSKDTTMIKAYKKAWQKRIKKLEIDTTSFKQGFSIPESNFANREAIAYEQNSSGLKLHIKASDSTFLLDRFNIWINEVPVYGQKGISVRNKETHTIDTSLTVTLSNGSNRIETSVLNVNGIESYRLPLYVNHTPKEVVKEKLYFAGIGIDRYQEEGHNLNYSVKDIRDLSIQLKEKYGNEIEIDTLFNQNVTIKNILELKERLKNSRVDDKVIISFSGHGLLSKDLDYYLATYDVNFNSPKQNGLPYDDLEYLLDSIPSRKKLLLIDACHSGEVDKDEVEAIAQVEKKKEGLKGSIAIKSKNSKMGLKNSFELMKELFNNIDRATGATIISAAAGTQFAQERGELKNGVFTYCILNQLKEKKSIKLSELKTIVSSQVQELTNGLQQPTSRNETIENDWRVW